MEVNKIISHAITEYAAEQTSESICEGHLKTDPYGIKRKQLRNVTEGSGGTGGLHGGKPFLS